MPKLTDREPLDESTADHAALLADLQCNILSSSGRPNTHYFFLNFRNREQAIHVLRALARGEKLTKVPKLESELDSRKRRAARQKAAPDERGKPSGGLSSSLLLSARCYIEFLDEHAVPPDAAFRQGMSDRDESLGIAAKLNDAATLAPKAPVHALFVVGYDAGAGEWADARQQIVSLLDSTEVTFWDKAGYLLRHPKDHYPMEPFGYHDAISQPLFFRADLEAGLKYDGSAGTVLGGKWTSFAPLSLVLVADPNGATDQACGSYVAYRKIKQKVDFFYEQASRLAEELGKLPNVAALSRDEVADRLIGRRADGTPLDLPPGQPGRLNDFTYPSNSVCPLHAHARKVNPRDPYTHNRRIVRRATVFGPELKRKDDGRPVIPTGLDDANPSDDVGLLFFCCQSDIANQFEAIQGLWANQASGGADTVIGQLPPNTTNKIGLNGSGIKFTYEPVVKVMEGEYFFAPSISFLLSKL